MDLFDTRRRKEMLKFLTQKLKAQSLNEVSPFQPCNNNIEECDSGTESDEENAELQTLEAMQEETENQPGTALLPTVSSTSPLACPTRRPFQLVSNHSPARVPPSAAAAAAAATANKKTHDSSDFERGSFDYEPRSSSEFERHSSEEELCILTEATTAVKKSMPLFVNGINESSGSSDEEVRDLFNSKPARHLAFSSSPPKALHRTAKSPSHVFVTTVTSPYMCSVSPRKRHRQSHDDSDDATVMQRPCLDFYKMQGSQTEKSTVFRKHVSPHGISKGRLVKIKGLSSGNANCLYDPAVFAFRSISTYSPLPPVEEPSCAF